jgi:nitrogen fixation protein FixH
MSKTTQSNKKPLIIGAAILVVLIAVFGTVYFFFRPKTAGGEKSISVEVIDNTGASTVYNHNTDAEYLRQALEEIEGLTVEGEESDYGLYVKTVNGITADYETDGAYWAFYTNGEYSQNGIDSEPVHDNDSFSIKYEKANAE